MRPNEKNARGQGPFPAKEKGPLPPKEEYPMSQTSPAASAAFSLVSLNDWSPTKTTCKVPIAHVVIDLAIVAAFFVPAACMFY